MVMYVVVKDTARCLKSREDVVLFVADIKLTSKEN